MRVNLKSSAILTPFPLLVFSFVLSFCFMSYSFNSFHSVTQYPKSAGRWENPNNQNLLPKEIVSSNLTAINCTTTTPAFDTSDRGEYLVYYNYIMRTNEYNCNESITLTTHGESIYILENVEILAQRWNGPLGIAVVTMGTDYEVAMRTIMYLRKCGNPVVQRFVTFHLVIHKDHVPEDVLLPEELFLFEPADCSEFNVTDLTNGTYRKENDLVYPINVARNAARDAANTYFVLPSDIELYPSIDLIPQFMEFIQRNPKYLSRDPPSVFVVPVFEVEGDKSPPSIKSELVDLYLDKKAVVFHSYTCPECQRMPMLKTWLKDKAPLTMEVKRKTKRQGRYRFWEPIYIGTHHEVPFDERLSWEGRKDKMVQMTILCLLNYDLQVLNNAFLVHKPGIKKDKTDVKTYASYIRKQNTIISKKIRPEIINNYGYKKRCSF